MPRYVALFRGINVGNAKRIAMADLRKVMESLGYRQVETLLNSGNAVFDAANEPDAKHARRIREAVLKKLGVDALVVVKPARDIAAVISGNKLGKVAANPSLLLVALTNDAKGWNVLESIARAPGMDRRRSSRQARSLCVVSRRNLEEQGGRGTAHEARRLGHDAKLGDRWKRSTRCCRAGSSYFPSM